MIKASIAALAIGLPTLDAFGVSPTFHTAQSSRVNTNYAGIRTAVCSESMSTRRAVLAGIISLPLAGSLPAVADTGKFNRDEYLQVSTDKM
jgi:hypothetical protein